MSQKKKKNGFTMNIFDALIMDIVTVQDTDFRAGPRHGSQNNS